MGGGDYGENRIVPDCVNSLIKSETISVRNPHSTRPWQYILDVLNGYLLIGQKLLQQDHSVATSWNIGPLLPSVITVKKLVEEIIYNWGSGSWEDVSKIGTLEEIKKEAKLLNLDISKAYFEIGFRPQYNIKETIAKTVNWYKNYNENNAYDLCLEEINHFEKKMKINVVESQTEEPMMDERKQSIITENESVENINHYSEIKKCRYCHGSNIKMFLDYGMMPLVNNLLSSESNCNHDPKFPLNLYFCKSCGLVQIGSIVHPEKMFSNYLYFSSTSSTFCQHGFDFASLMKTRFNLDNNSFVVEIASNDGAVLKSFKELGIPFLGVDPAENIVKLANEKGIKTKCAYFNSKIAEEIAVDSGKADLIYGMNVFAHIPEIHDFVLGVKKILKDNGVIVIEAPYIIDFIKKVEFDTVYHEHVNYLGLHAMTNLFKQFDLELFDAQWVDIHGGSMRYFFCKRGIQRISENVHHFLNSEKEAGLFNEQTYLDFAQKVFNLKEDLLILLQKLKSQGKKIVAYAASAKGIVLLNYCGIGGDYIDFVVDKSVYKQNHFIPGVNLEIKDPKLILDEQPDYILLLAWNFKKEIMAEQKEYLAKGGKFIIPIPTPLIESGNTLQEQQEDKER